MGIFCEINLFKPPNNIYKPGDIVAGVIKYALHEPIEFETIITSLKGNGRVSITVSRGKSSRIYTQTEKYVDIDDVISATNIEVPIGSYETKFNFILPEDIPSSLEYKNRRQRSVKCRIKYYIRIKFERPGWFAFSKHFRKEIIVVSGITPKLLMEPVIYGDSKKLLRLFSRKNAIIDMKAQILNSVMPVGGNIQINYEIKNDTNVEIGCVESKLVEVYTFKAEGCSDAIHKDEIPNTTSRSGNIDCGVTRSWPLILDVPVDRFSMQYSKIVSRDYVVRITVELPMPHINMVLDIPVQVGTLRVSNMWCQPRCISMPSTEGPEVSTYEEAPPSYWEAMGEMGKGDMSDDDDN